MKKLKKHNIPQECFLEDKSRTTEISYQIPFPKSTVWKALVDAETWSKWVNGIEEVIWTSPAPLQQGATRTVKGGATIEEVFYHWVDEREMAFYFERSSLPIRTFAESYSLRENEQGCELIWKFRTEANPVLRIVFNFILRRNGRQGFPLLESYIASNPGKFQ